ncbi:MAG: hypothetical protein JSU63_13530 [Phycisphaerales bacterium]|nr:MAG: hypothetical protein JSU63_13530 [Phycisphaerales bacterium]
MSDWLTTHKPTASARLQLLLAAAMWSTVGTLLLYFGVRWIWAKPSHYPLLLTAAAAGAGLVKVRFVLRYASGRLIHRIRARGDGYCIGGFLSWRTWLFVLFMIALGRLLRGGALPRSVVGPIYAAVGMALLVGSCWIWLAWRRYCSIADSDIV